MHQFSLFTTVAHRIDHGVSDRFTEGEQVYDVHANQVHGHAVVWANEPNVDCTQEQLPQADAIITTTPNLRLRVGVRDCAPIIAYDSEQQMVAVVHAGFKGTTQRVLLETLNNSQKPFNPKATLIGIGPAIGPCCYHNIDIQTENRLQAIEYGIPNQHIEVMRYCTRCNTDTWYSYRAGDDTNFGIYAKLLHKKP